MPKVLRPIGHEDRLSIVDHLDELRSRLIICLVALLVAFGVCWWQNHALLNLLNRALPHNSSVTTSQGLGSVPSQAVVARNFYLSQAAADRLAATSPGLSDAARQAYARAAANAQRAALVLPDSVSTQEKPITLGVGEPFTTTLTVAAYFALLFTLPLLIYEAYAFVIPALNPNERRVATPLMMVAPALFLSGVVFAFVIVLPPAVHFLQGYNSQEFQILVQAKTYYKFEMFTMIGIGIAFQVPLALLALQRLGIMSSRTLIHNWRYAIVLIAIAAAALPGVDPVSMMFEALPLVLLYGASIVLLKVAEFRDAKRNAVEFPQVGGGFDIT